MRCNKCNGDGYTMFEEDGHMVTHPCYRCGTKGELSEEEEYEMKLSLLAETLASSHVRAKIKARNSDPEGEDWAFCAAEDMMTEHEYTEMHVYCAKRDFIEDLGKLSPKTLLALCDALWPKPEPKPEPKAESPKPAVQYTDDEIPF